MSSPLTAKPVPEKDDAINHWFCPKAFPDGWSCVASRCARKAGMGEEEACREMFILATGDPEPETGIEDALSLPNVAPSAPLRFPRCPTERRALFYELLTLAIFPKLKSFIRAVTTFEVRHRLDDASRRCSVLVTRGARGPQHTYLDTVPLKGGAAQ